MNSNPIEPDESRGKAGHQIDPDPWTLIQVVTGIVGVIGTFAQIAMSYRDQTGLLPAEQRTSTDDIFIDAIREAIKNIEALARFLARAKIQPSDILDRRFYYGETSMLVDVNDFDRLRRIGESLVHSLDIVFGLSMVIIRHHPERAKQLGQLLNNEMNDFARRLNSFFNGETANGVVIDECLVMIRTFERLIAQLDGN